MARVKYIVLFLMVWVDGGAAAAAGAGLQRVRVTETSVTETGRFTGEPSVKLVTRGFGFSYIASCGAGGAYTMLSTKGENDGTSIDLKHNYLDLTYTYGERWLVTGGFGVGVSGEGSVSAGGVTVDGNGYESRALTLGPGFGVSWFEIYWLHRRNWASYEFDGETHVLASSHYQLGLGARF